MNVNLWLDANGHLPPGRKAQPPYRDFLLADVSRRGVVGEPVPFDDLTVAAADLEHLDDQDFHVTVNAQVILDGRSVASGAAYSRVSRVAGTTLIVECTRFN